MKKIFLFMLPVLLLASCGIYPVSDENYAATSAIVSAIQGTDLDTVSVTVLLDTNSLLNCKRQFKREGYLLQKEGDKFSLLKKETKTRYTVKFAPVNPDYYFTGTNKIILSR